jgi:hypothetical protein
MVGGQNRLAWERMGRIGLVGWFGGVGFLTFLAFLKTFFTNRPVEKLISGVVPFHGASVIGAMIKMATPMSLVSMTYLYKKLKIIFKRTKMQIYFFQIGP